MTNAQRRRFLFGISTLASALAAAGCGSSSGDAAPAPAPAPTADPTAPVPAPDVPPTPAIPVSGWRPDVPAFSLDAGTTFDLRTTLPTGTKAGGQFAVDPAGAALPPGMSLSANGVLTVGTATPGAVTGVIFTYEVT